MTTTSELARPVEIMEVAARDGFHLVAVADRVAALPGACVGGHLREVPRARAVPEPAH
ncbi:hypothetical protein BH23PSE1_BH23PSE1_09930 [soil metagenome]